MKKKNKILMTVAVILLGGIYLFPIWSIQLEAPQYPEGIGLNIWVDTIAGKQPQDLQNINGLNHYIGMKPIVPDSIPELQIMPYLVGFLIASGLLVALFGNRHWLMGWLILFLALAVTGLIDFYLWEYDYGHNLDPNAPIKVPGMTYQPPLLGSKQLLNIKATSLPHVGFFMALGSMVLAGWVWWKERSEHGESDTSETEEEMEKAA